MAQAIDILSRTPWREIQRRGWHFQKKHFYSACNDCEFLEQNPDLLLPHEPPGIRWDLEGQMATAIEVAGFVEELRDVPQLSPDGSAVYCWGNPFWNNADALVQYGLVRSRQPARYVEVGCGYSSLLLSKALAKNEKPCTVDLVEPFPDAAIFSALPQEWRRHRLILQRVPPAVFDALEAGDILFYDGSHVSKPASDVNWFFFHVLPRLRRGVLIHLHDVFLPDHYPADWIFERGQTWNEQYVLQAFLMHNAEFRILIANRYLWRHRRAELDRLYRGIQPSRGCSFWMVKG